MTEDEKLVEKVAEAMWNAAHGANYKWSDCVQNRTYELAINIQRNIARAAIAAVREHDKEKGLVHTGRTGAERSSDLSAVDEEEAERRRLWRHMRACIEKREAVPDYVTTDMIKGALDALDFAYDFDRPNVDRTAPAASREPDLPSSLTAPHRHMKGGIQG